jgi:hypothetical protein
MVGTLKKAQSSFTHLLVVVDKFAKWIEVKPIDKTNSQEAVKFFLDIVYRFGVPNTIITDNVTNFTGRRFLELACGYRIRIDWASVRHHAPTGRFKGRMEWSSRDSSLASSTNSKSLLDARSRNSQLFSGA